VSISNALSVEEVVAKNNFKKNNLLLLTLLILKLIKKYLNCKNV